MWLKYALKGQKPYKLPGILKLLPLQGDRLASVKPRAMPWARSFCPFRACGAKLAKLLYPYYTDFQIYYTIFSIHYTDPIIVTPNSCICHFFLLSLHRFSDWKAAGFCKEPV